MEFTLGSASLPALQQALHALNGMLDKAIASGAARKIDDAVFLQARLAPDMFALVRQVQIACDFAVKTAARLAGVDAPSFPDVETSFAELKTRIASAAEFVAAQSPEKITSRTAEIISFPVGPDIRKLKADVYLMAFALPNLYFHAGMAYAILRHNGVDVGKGDFLAGVREKMSA